MEPTMNQKRDAIIAAASALKRGATVEDTARKYATLVYDPTDKYGLHAARRLVGELLDCAHQVTARSLDSNTRGKLVSEYTSHLPRKVGGTTRSKARSLLDSLGITPESIVDGR